MFEDAFELKQRLSSETLILAGDPQARFRDGIFLFTLSKQKCPLVFTFSTTALLKRNKAQAFL